MTLLFSLPGGGEWFIILALGVFLIPTIFYLITLQSTLEAVSYENRKMSPGNVWLLLIPFFATVYHFIVIKKLADSIKDEAISKGIPVNEPMPAYNIGLAMCILNCLLFLPLVKLFVGMAALICWILYWVKISSYKNILSQHSINNQLP